MLSLLLVQDVEVPLHLLRYVCLFCGKHGLSLMKECFESGTPESLPFPIAHAFITIVSNVSPLTQTQELLTADYHFNWAAGSQYKAADEVLPDRTEAKFRRKMDLGKIVARRQQPHEIIVDYLTCLSKVHEDNSDIRRSQPNGNGDIPVSEWEGYLRDRFIQGMMPEIQEHMKEHCVGHETARLHDVENHAAHAKRLIKEKYKNKKRKKVLTTQNQKEIDSNAGQEQMMKYKIWLKELSFRAHCFLGIEVN